MPAHRVGYRPDAPALAALSALGAPGPRCRGMRSGRQRQAKFARRRPEPAVADTAARRTTGLRPFDADLPLNSTEDRRRLGTTRRVRPRAIMSGRETSRRDPPGAGRRPRTILIADGLEAGAP
jgi:hypothetical protein